MKESPELVFGDEMLCVRNVGLFENGIFMYADEEIRYVLLKDQFGGFFCLAMRFDSFQAGLHYAPLAGHTFMNQ